MGRNNQITVLILGIRFYFFCPCLIVGRKSAIVRQVHDSIGKYIADTLATIFSDYFIRYIFRQTIPVKFFRNRPFNGFFTGNLRFPFYYRLCFFQRFLCFFLFVPGIGFFPCRR